MSQDRINHPSHYTFYKGIEVIDVTEELNFNLGNAVKYVARAGHKDSGTHIEDLLKADWYLIREIDRIHRGRAPFVPNFYEVQVDELSSQMNFNLDNVVSHICRVYSTDEELVENLLTARGFLQREIHSLKRALIGAS